MPDKVLIGGQATARLVLSLGGTQTIAWASSYYLPAVLAAPMAKELGCPVSLVYAAFSIALIVAALTTPFAGRYIDLWGGKRILAGSSFWFAASLFFLSHVQGPVSLFFAWASLGVAMGAGLYDMAFATVVRSYGTNSPPAIAGITLCAGFASTVSWPVTQFFMESLGWREAFLVWACIQLFLGLPLNLSLALPAGIRSGQETSSKTAPEQKKPARQKNHTAYALAIAFVFISFCSTAMASHMPALLQLYGVTAAMSLAAGMLLGPSQVAARVLQLTLLRKVKPIQTAFIASLVIPLGALLLLVLGPGTAPAFGVSHGFGNGVMTIVKGTLPLELFGKEGYGQRQGWLFLPAGIVQACSPFVFSLCIMVLGKAALCVYILFCLAAAVIFLWLMRAQKK